CSGVPRGAPGLPTLPYTTLFRSQTTGFVLLLLLEPGGAVKQVVEIEPPPGAGDGYGSALAPLGDLDGDGALDLAVGGPLGDLGRSEEHTSELQSRENRVCRLLLE